MVNFLWRWNGDGIFSQTMELQWFLIYSHHQHQWILWNQPSAAMGLEF